MESLPIELAMYEALKKWETAENAKEYISRYDLAKSILNKDILPWIRTTEPNLSDHGSDHIENVLNNAYKLIEPAIKGLLLCDVTKDQPNFSHLDLYFLCQSILFHDVGNLFGRDNHNQTACKIINEKFSSIFPRTGSHKKQRKIIISAGRAHTGKNTEGRKDTLKDLEVHENFNGNKISLRDIATILRFADELAEGPQRTSSYLLQIGAFSEESTIYHQYADSIELYIDPLNERISLFYGVELSAIEGDGLTKDQTEKVQELLKLIYIRIVKLDEERKYARYYSTFLENIKMTQVKIDFLIDGDSIGFKRKEFTLNDLTIPGENHSNELFLMKENPDLELTTLISDLNSHIQNNKEQYQ